MCLMCYYFEKWHGYNCRHGGDSWRFGGIGSISLGLIRAAVFLSTSLTELLVSAASLHHHTAVWVCFFSQFMTQLVCLWLDPSMSIFFKVEFALLRCEIQKNMFYCSFFRSPSRFRRCWKCFGASLFQAFIEGLNTQLATQHTEGQKIVI